MTNMYMVRRKEEYTMDFLMATFSREIAHEVVDELNKAEEKLKYKVVAVLWR